MQQFASHASSAHLESTRSEGLISAALDEQDGLRHGVIRHGGRPPESPEAQQAAPVPVISLHGPRVPLDDVLHTADTT